MPAVKTRGELLGSLAAATLFVQAETPQQRFDRLMKDLLILGTHTDS